MIGYGVNYRSGSAIHEATHMEGMEQPEHIWVPSIGASGLAFYTGDKFPEWQGNLLAGGLAGQNIDRLTIEDGEVVASETILRGMGRVRDIRQGPDGYIYVALEARGDGQTPIVRLGAGNVIPAGLCPASRRYIPFRAEIRRERVVLTFSRTAPPASGHSTR